MCRSPLCTCKQECQFIFKFVFTIIAVVYGCGFTLVAIEKYNKTASTPVGSQTPACQCKLQAERE